MPGPKPRSYTNFKLRNVLNITDVKDRGSDYCNKELGEHTQTTSNTPGEISFTGSQHTSQPTAPLPVTEEQAISCGGPP